MRRTKRKLLRIYCSTLDKADNKGSLFEAIMKASESMQGVSVFKGISSVGSRKQMHSFSILSLSQELPVVVEIVDSEAKIEAFLQENCLLLASAFILLLDAEVVQCSI